MGSIVKMERKPVDERDEFDKMRKQWKNTPLPQGTHEEPFDYKLWWLAVLISWTVVGLIVFGIRALFVP